MWRVTDIRADERCHIDRVAQLKTSLAILSIHSAENPNVLTLETVQSDRFHSVLVPQKLQLFCLYSVSESSTDL